MPRKSAVPGLVVVCCLAGCYEPRFVKAGMTPESLRADGAECAQSASKQAEYDAAHEVRTSALNKVTSTTDIHSEINAVYQRRYRTHLTACMRDRGYEEYYENQQQVVVH